MQFQLTLPAISRVRSNAVGIVLVAAVTVVTAQQADTARTTLEAARKMEVVDGDLDGAIRQYQAVIDKSKNDRAIAADALVRMAGAHEKLGHAEALKIYERLIREYADQTEPAALARTRLGRAEGAQQPGGIALRMVWDGDTSGTISQDGRRLSYQDYAAGNLRVRDLVDGTDHPITVSDYNVFESAISRDGTQVAYPWINNSRGLELRITSVQGSDVVPSRRLFTSDDVSWISPMDWSPDGKTIAVSLQRRDQTAQIGLLTVPEGSLQVLQSVDWRGPTRIFFSPNGRDLGFDLPVNDTNGQRDVFVLAVDGSREIPAVVHPSQDVMMGWSPDGKHLLFASDRQGGSMGLWALPIAEGKPRGTPELVKASIGTGWSLGVSTNGALYMGTRAGDGDVGVVSIDLATGKQIGAPARPIQSFIGSTSQPHWSPDGKHLAYVSARGFNPTNNRDRIIAIQSLETANVREIRPRLSYFNQFNWSPDGRSFITGGTNLKGRSGVFRIDAQTGEVAPVVDLSPEGNNSYPQWSPDGKRIYYRNPFRGGSENGVVERDLATGREREVIGRGLGGGPINLSPDGRWIAMGMGRGDTSSNLSAAIVLIPVDGGEPRELLRAGQSERFANFQGMPWTPDGRGFLVRKRLPRTSELWFVPIAGEPRKLDVDASQWTNGPVGALSLHPDGRQLAILLQSSKPGREVWALENFLPAFKPAQK